MTTMWCDCNVHQQLKTPRIRSAALTQHELKARKTLEKIGSALRVLEHHIDEKNPQRRSALARKIVRSMISNSLDNKPKAVRDHYMKQALAIADDTISKQRTPGLGPSIPGNKVVPDPKPYLSRYQNYNECVSDLIQNQKVGEDIAKEYCAGLNDEGPGGSEPKVGTIKSAAVANYNQAIYGSSIYDTALFSERRREAIKAKRLRSAAQEDNRPAWAILMDGIA